MPVKIPTLFGAEKAPRKKRKPNPESIITAQITESLDILCIPHFKHWGGPFGTKGVPDIIGTIPSLGRALWCEIKVPGRTATPEQESFLAKHQAAGGLTMVATSAKDVVVTLAIAGYSPAHILASQLYPLALFEAQEADRRSAGIRP